MAIYMVTVQVGSAKRRITGQVEAGNKAGALSRFVRDSGLREVARWKAWPIEEDGTPRNESWTEMGAT